MSSKAALSDSKHDLSELGSKEKTVGAGCVLRSAGANISEEWKRLDMLALVSGVLCHVHVTLANGLTVIPTK
jgi:hypothetical protein